MKRILVMAGLALAALLGLWYLSRGAVPSEEMQACNAESWISLPDRELLDGVGKVPGDDYRMLRGNLLKLALQKLETASFYRLSEEEIAAARIDSREAGWPYFMRAVTFSPERNEIRVGVKGRDYFVTHIEQGKQGTSMKCWPVLIFLKEPPERVFVRAEAEE